MPRLAIMVVAAICFPWTPVSEAASNCTSVQAQCAVEIGGQCDPNTGRWFYGRYMERSPAALKWPSMTAFRASCLKSASDRNSAIRRVL
jgi:hypothetical protein